MLKVFYIFLNKANQKKGSLELPQYEKIFTFQKPEMS